MDSNDFSPRTRCVQCISCANAIDVQDTGPAGCAAGATPPAWTERCDYFVQKGQPLRFHDRRRGDRRQDGGPGSGGRTH